jgi:hypothetical protein
VLQAEEHRNDRSTSTAGLNSFVIVKTHWYQGFRVLSFGILLISPHECRWCQNHYIQGNSTEWLCYHVTGKQTYSQRSVPFWRWYFEGRTPIAFRIFAFNFTTTDQTTVVLGLFENMATFNSFGVIVSDESCIHELQVDKNCLSLQHACCRSVKNTSRLLFHILNIRVCRTILYPLLQGCEA